MRFDKKDKPKINAGDVIRASIQRDFKRPSYTQHKREEQQPPQVGAVRRVAFVNNQSSYFPYRAYLIGKAVRIIRPGYECGFECQFIHEADRVAINAAAGWSDAKETYLLDGVKFK